MKTKYAVALGATFFLFSQLVSAAGDLAVEKVDGSFPGTKPGTSAPLIEKVPSFTDDQVADFEVHKGERMHDAMDRWTRMVGYTLVWQPKPEDGDITFATDMTYRDTFKDAATEFFKLVRAQTIFDGQVHENGVLRVFVASETE